MRNEILPNDVEDLMNQEASSVRREKFELRATKNILSRLVMDGELTLDSTVKEVVEKITEEINRIKDISA